MEIQIKKANIIGFKAASIRGRFVDPPLNTPAVLKNYRGEYLRINGHFVETLSMSFFLDFADWITKDTNGNKD